MHRSTKLLIVCTALGALAAAAPAQSLTAFTFQGELRQSDTPADGIYSVRFSLWSAETGGAQIGSDILLNDVEVSDGMLKANLDFGVQAFGGSPRWLQVAVNGVTLAPRQAVTGAPFAIQTRGIYVDDSGRVGLGTTVPGNNMDIAGADANLLLRTVGNSSGPRIKLRNPSSGSNTVTGRIDFEDPSVVASIGYVKPLIGPPGLQFSNATEARMKITDAGYVGIGTLDPAHHLHVAGRFHASTSTAGPAVQAVNSSSASFSYAISGTSASTQGGGIYGISSSASGTSFGVGGRTDSTTGIGVQGWATQSVGDNIGVGGYTNSNSGTGVRAEAFASSGVNYGLFAEVQSTQGRAVYAVNRAVSGNGYAVHGHVLSANGWAAYFTGTAGSWNYFQRNVGIGVINPSFQLHLGSNSAAKPTSNTWTISSDARLKTDITTISGALDDLLRLRGVTYRWINPESQGAMSGVYTGLIAQEVEEVFTEWIGEDEQGFKTLTVIGFEGLVVEALRGLREEKDEQIASLGAESAALDALCTALRTENRELRVRLEALEEAVAALTAKRQQENMP